jgi:LPS sulfotransferase NodH
LLVIGGFFRCGSNYLGSLLDSTGVLGHPKEYFNPKYSPLTAYVVDGEIDFFRAFSSICAAATTPNGVAAVKLFPSQFDFLLANTDFGAWFPDISFVWLQRGDLLGQAISLCIAGHTGEWTGTHGEREEVQFDRAKIDHAIDAIAGAHRYWAGFFARNGIAPQIVTYERLSRDPAAVVREIAAGLDCALPECGPISSKLIIQRDSRNEAFRELYLKGKVGMASGKGKIGPVSGDRRLVRVQRTLRKLIGVLAGRPI